MCNRALNWAFEQKLPPIEKLVLVAIANMLNSKTNLCWPSQETLATRCGICRQRVNKALARLRDMGLVLVERCRHACRYSLPPLPPRDVAYDDTLDVTNSDTTPQMSPLATSDVAISDTNLKEPKKEDSVAYATGADAPPDPIKELWDRGVKALGDTRHARSLIGKMRNEHGDLPVMDAILACERTHPTDPIAYLRGCLEGKVKGNSNGKRSPVEKLYAGFAQAAGGFSFGGEANDPLLDSR